MNARRTDLTQARTPRGFADRGAAELAATRAMADRIRETYELWGFEEVETPFFEYTDALGKFLPDQDRPNAGVFSLQDDDEQWMSLRYDLTAPLARHVAENFQKLAKPYRSYRFGPVFRNEKPGPGRFRQFLQFDADIVGAPSVSADAEMCMMMADALEAVGVKRGDYVIKVNNRKILDGVMEAIGLGGEENAGRRLTVLRAIDKLDRLGPDGVRALLGDGRKDESGDFTKGAGLDEAGAARVLSILEAKRSTNAETAEALAAEFAATPVGAKGATELKAIADLLAAAGYDGRVSVDPSVVRGLEYYTGPVYEAELTFQIAGDDGKPIQFGSVGGGGRYDGLVGRFMAENTPATGFSIGVSRLQAALRALKGETAEASTGPVVVLAFDRDRIGDSMALAARLRAAGIKAEAYLGGSGMKAQMKYADRRKSPCVVIQGSDERDKGEVTLKDLVEGAKAAAAIADRAEWTESRPAQVTVPEARLVEEVQAILARHR
ncbi:histidyl-tRNA synthetase [Methylopila capsulata]|uniref:Histidine--tRNA ligase n=1 Tax=Methylopila capsulata TaxID=61654 RepID=A0A9W6MT16_9HYPH|nr:histidine--tRNA ligase [Methylopila capsulata]MBM7852580.1 histidyl-tRNA synthetase [Methylopila capsulata]GLK56787.1 histidine--tRNA ligase [Methylopila capsulata]